MSEQQVMSVEADTDAAEAVLEAIESLDFVRESRPAIHVRVENGVATLSGLVLSEVMHRAVVYKTATAPGVRKVFDHLIEDGQLRLAVARALADEPALKEFHSAISVNSYQGMVSVSGPALDETLREKVKEIASQIPGVREVVIRPG